MHATISTNPKRFGGLRIGIIAVTAGALAAAAQMGDYTFVEQNTQLPDGTLARATAESTSYKFLEENTQLPGDVGSPVRSFAEIEFLEQNTWLPAGGEDLNLLAPENRAPSPLVNF
jgi:hypothetical protein